MAENLKILGNAKLDGTSNYADIYQVGGAVRADDGVPVVQAIVGSIVVCETNNVPATVSIELIPGSLNNVTTITGKEFVIFHELALVAKETRIISPGITISAQDRIRAIASTADVNIFIFGSEIS